MVRKHKRGINHLYALRRNRGLLQKHVALLIGHRYPHMVSQYESGTSLPPLETALLLEIILGARLSEMYVDLFEELKRLVLKRARGLTPELRRRLSSRLLGKD
jgi:hypothetical protein